MSRRTATVVRRAPAGAGAPAGVFGLIEGERAGVDALRHPALRAAAFTGSQRGGLTLARIAAERPEPIPFYGELGSVNPVVVTPGAAEGRGTCPGGPAPAGWSGRTIRRRPRPAC
ncbi:aldehyde dehydrogenase family protein [Streptomyces misionensis]|uniref:aldehyde dehydrogenase family protein n=1 Tax=Streptomyces misionensis TaxID=67331 RepID=UPI001C938B67|nr:aldehyde dehydrogenase family protein [Streptomyces misionensis]